MPKTKAQGILFGLIMSYSMAIGMEIYNTASALGFAQQLGGLSNLRSAVFLPALRETLCMGLIVFIVSNLWGNRIGAKIAAAQCDPARDHPTFCRLLRQAGTVAIMCPSMCLIGSILFQLLPGRAPAARAARRLARHTAQKPPHGLLLEHVRRRTLYPLALPRALPGEVPRAARRIG